MLEVRERARRNIANRGMSFFFSIITVDSRVGPYERDQAMALQFNTHFQVTHQINIPLHVLHLVE